MGGNPIQDIRLLANLIKLRELAIGIEDHADGEFFDYDNLQFLKQKLAHAKFDIWWNSFIPNTYNQSMQRIAFNE